MKPWQYLLLGVLFGLAGSALILLISSTPRGKPVVLVPPGTPKPISVHVAGSVANPGVYNLPRESRVIDLINLAGGLTTQAASASINLAAPLQDGQKITIPAIQDNIQKPVVEKTDSPSFITGGQTIKKININLADVIELETLPGIGTSKALAIIEYRSKNGPFRNSSDIQNVPGIGSGIFEKLKDLICITEE